ncbi:MAG: hypothetical protein H6747_05015 [Deltaproteobacteria bacterium]|nr:hypothetical protein [Deltaproteobacteria bacterium]
MRERALVDAALTAAAAWAIASGGTGVASRRECRTTPGHGPGGGVGRADGLVVWRDDDAALLVAVVEAKSPALLLATVPRPSLQRPGVTVPALEQLRAYPGNAHILCCHDQTLDADPLVRQVLQACCERDGVGLLAVNWYGETSWRVAPVLRPTPWLWTDCLDGYAAGPKLRAARPTQATS